MYKLKVQASAIMATLKIAIALSVCIHLYTHFKGLTLQYCFTFYNVALLLHV